MYEEFTAFIAQLININICIILLTSIITIITTIIGASEMLGS